MDITCRQKRELVLVPNRHRFIQALQTGRFLTEPDIRARGWTAEEIREYLPEPKAYANPYQRPDKRKELGETVRVWKRSVVLEAERRKGC